MSLLALPPELLSMILRRCTGRTRIRLAAVSRRLRRLHRKPDPAAALALGPHFLQDQDQSLPSIYVPGLLSHLSQAYPNLRSLSLRGCPVVITSDLVQLLARALPQLEGLDLSATRAGPQMSRGSLACVHELRRLRHLRLDGLPVAADAHQLLLPRLHLLPELESYGHNCQSGLLFRILQVGVCGEGECGKAALQVLSERRAEFRGLRRLELGGRPWVSLNDSDFRLLLGFVRRHSESLADVRFNDFLFESKRQAESLGSALQGCPGLRGFRLSRCRVRGEAATFDAKSPLRHTESGPEALICWRQ